MIRRDTAELAADIIITIAEGVAAVLVLGCIAVWWVLT